MTDNPVFYDPSGRRARWTLWAVLALALVLVVSIVTFAMTVISVPIPAPLAMTMERPHPRPLDVKVARLKHKLVKNLAWTRFGGTAAEAAVKQTIVGFYAPWDDASFASLSKNIGRLDWLVPSLISVTGPSHQFTVAPDLRLDALLANAPKRPKLLMLVQNARDGTWDGAGAAALLADPRERRVLLDKVMPQIEARKAGGVVFDLEDLPASAQRDYLQLLSEAKARFASRSWLVTLAVPVDNPEWNLAAYAKVADRLFLMIYDEHWIGGESGPIASQNWFVDHLRAARKLVGPDKAIVAVGNYAYDWTAKAPGLPGSTVSQSVEEAWLSAHDSGAKIRFDVASGNATFDYEEAGRTHHVWILDAVSAWNQLRATDAAGVYGVAVWRLGTEDPDIWAALEAFQTGKVPDLTKLESMGNVAIEGSGELIRIEHTPTGGTRNIVADTLGFIRDEQYVTLPTPFVVRRTGFRPGLVALTFDDGPDPDWTPRILDILKAKQASAAFFVIGENAITQPGLLSRIIDEGHELGNHSYTHPNLALVSGRGTRLELNATQRLIEAYTGRAMRLFRAPYFGDAEPTTADELGPALLAQNDGYINVGLHVDPGDWKRPGVDEIVARTLKQVEAGDIERSGNVVLLHDGGGDRTQTIAALPLIIDGLRAHGYRIVPVAELAGLGRAEVMPLVGKEDLFAVRADVGVFLIVAGLDFALRWLFVIAIALGIARSLILAALALGSRRASVRPVPPQIDPTRFVSVIIPAFNEARVIKASVTRVLASTDVELEIIVVDDGSTDGTSAIVAEAFANEPKVRLVTLVNGGKARALNHALMLATGDIVVSLDADTEFEPQTIARLARWFADDNIGAVAGNAKVGNRVNLVTRWQAVEYVTAQNLERRALARFDAITVVPGAVGAWRKAALAAVGGYPTDTLAEDQDLTIAIQRAGWRVGYDTDAVAWTEAPETFRALARQRYRWAFGTLQCLWKHRSLFRSGRPAGLAWIGLPQAWLFQIGFALISPIIDLALLVSFVSTAIRVNQHGWAQTQSDVLRMAVFWVAFTAIDVVCGWVAYRLDSREKRYPALLLVAQRFIYRQIMYSVVLRAVAAALRGPSVGWGKLERSGRIDSSGSPATV